MRKRYEMTNETYLGDGLYVSHDGWQFALRAPGPGGDQTVYLEPSVLSAFQRYVHETRKRYESADAE